jgi:hypothetical protein
MLKADKNNPIAKPIGLTLERYPLGRRSGVCSNSCFPCLISLDNANGRIMRSHGERGQETGFALRDRNDHSNIRFFFCFNFR